MILGTAADAAVARKIGRTVAAVTVKRVRLGIPAFSGWSEGGRGWVEDELALLGTDSDEAISDRIGRTHAAVRKRRTELHILRWSPRRARK